MPIYEYRCTRCDRKTEVIQKFSDPPLTTCTECSGRLEKLVSRTSFQLKGGGWFGSGYGNAAPTDGTDKKDKKKDATESKPDSGADSTSAKGGCGSGSCGCAG